MPATETITCKNCSTASTGKFCHQCGQKLATGRISLHSIFHEVFHYFTHVDKGFGYTLKQLITRPGTMQKEYIEGKRTKHQKPFSMFFLCGTISGLCYYLINLAYQNIYQKDTSAEAEFFRHYFMIPQAILLPVLTLILWFLFPRSKHNYAEILILSLYTVSVVFLAFIFINATRLIFPNFENRYVEVMFLLFYINLTNIRFFDENKWIVIGKTTIMLGLIYTLAQILTNQVALKLLE